MRIKSLVIIGISTLLLCSLFSCGKKESTLNLKTDLEKNNLKDEVKFVVEDYFTSSNTYLTKDGFILDTTKMNNRTTSFYERGDLRVENVLYFSYNDEERSISSSTLKTIDEYGRIIDYVYTKSKYYPSNTVRHYKYYDYKDGTSYTFYDSHDYFNESIWGSNNIPEASDFCRESLLKYDKEYKVLHVGGGSTRMFYDIDKLQKLYDLERINVHEESTSGDVIYRFFYDEFGRTTKEEYYDDWSERKLSTLINYKYSNEGDDEFLRKTEIEYSDNGDIDTTVYLYRNGIITTRRKVHNSELRTEILYSYNEHGDLIRKDEYVGTDKELDEITTYDYEYDERENWIIKKETISLLNYSTGKFRTSVYSITIRHIYYEYEGWDGGNSNKSLKKVIGKYYKPQSKKVSSSKANTQTGTNSGSESKSKLTPCPVCKGNPHKICNNCWGSGYVTRYVNIGGSLYSEPADCPLCIAGYTTCTACGGSGYIQSAVTPPPSTINDFPSTSSTFSTSGSHYDYQAEYNRWESQVRGIFQSLEAIGGFHSKNNDGSTSYSVNSSNGSSNQILLHNLISIQSEMRKTRQEAQKDGVTIYPSEWETKQPSFY